VIVVNLFGGPGVGKSTNATGLFYEMKKRYINGEYVSEYAKWMVWEKRTNILADQVYILAKQNRLLEQLQGHGVDYAVTDSPLPTGLLYTTNSYFPSYRPLLMEMFNQYENVNILLTRNHPYNPVGRFQDEAGALAVDKLLVRTLEENNIPYTALPSDDTTPLEILKILGFSV